MLEEEEVFGEGLLEEEEMFEGDMFQSTGSNASLEDSS